MIARVFPSRTAASPTDALAFFGFPPGRAYDAGIDQVLVSVTFSWDKPAAERLARVWNTVAPVTVGGPACGDPGQDFLPGIFLRPGFVITSRGCPNHCWFCDVPGREGKTRELPVADGWNVLDSNLLACSSEHQERVFQMLSRQAHRPVFTGGLEATRITPALARRLREIRTDRLFCAYDTPDDLEPLREAGKILQAAGFTRKHHLHAYVLCGFPKDRTEDAERRMMETWEAGFHPMAMLWRDPNREDWPKFARIWARPAITRQYLKPDPGAGRRE